MESVRDLLGRAEPTASVPGVVLAALSLAVMPVLARAKPKVAPVLGSRAAVSEANQTWLCAWLSAVLLVGLAANAALRHCQVSTLASSSRLLSAAVQWTGATRVSRTLSARERCGWSTR